MIININAPFRRGLCRIFGHHWVIEDFGWRRTCSRCTLRERKTPGDNKWVKYP